MRISSIILVLFFVGFIQCEIDMKCYRKHCLKEYVECRSDDTRDCIWLAENVSTCYKENCKSQLKNTP